MEIRHSFSQPFQISFFFQVKENLFCTREPNMTATLTDDQLRALKTEQFAKEFKDAAKEVMYNAAKLKSPQGKE